MEITDESVAESTGLSCSAITALRREKLDEGAHFTRRHARHGGGVFWTHGGLQHLAQLMPDLAPPLLAILDSPPPEPPKKPAADAPRWLIAIGPVNAEFLKARFEEDPAQVIKVRTSSPDLFPPNFRFQAIPWGTVNPNNWWQPTKLPRWKGKW